MQIAVTDLSNNGEVWVDGLYGPKHLEAQGKKCLEALNEVLAIMRGNN